MNVIVRAWEALVCLAILTSGFAPAESPKEDAAVRTPDPARTEAFRAKRYGLLTHYLDRLQNDEDLIQSLGRETSWDECVSEFDVERFANDVAQTGAGYVVFTTHQQTRFFCAPNAAFDRISGYRPGEACSRRDLIAELADALEARGIDLFLYWTGDGPEQDPKAMEAFKGEYPVTREFMENWAQVGREFSERYGDKIKGWWVDGSYEWIHTEETRGILAEALRSGNPNALLSFNSGVGDGVRAFSTYDDYTSGEQNEFGALPEQGRFLNGAQWHVLSFLGTWWCEPGTRMRKRELADYLWKIGYLGGVATIDVVLYRDGGLDRSQIETLRPLRSLLESRDKRAADGNLVVCADSELLDSKGEKNIPPFGPFEFPHLAEYGVDGDPETTAIADASNWIYRVRLVKESRASKLSILFGEENEASECEVFVKSSEGDWESLERFACSADQRLHEIDFAERDVAAVQVVSYSSDDPERTEAKMSVAELTLF